MNTPLRNPTLVVPLSSDQKTDLVPVKQLQVDRFLRIKDVLDRTSLSRSVLYRLIKAGNFPKQIKIGSTSVFSELAVIQWMDERKAGGVK